MASIVCPILCVALAGFWLESYDPLGRILVSGAKYRLSAEDGRIAFVPSVDNLGNPIYWDLTAKSFPLSHFGYGKSTHFYPGATNCLGFRLHSSLFGPVVVVPYWFLVLASGFLTMLFQTRWPLQFSLRQLFIATTFLAIVLGMIAWLDRAWLGK